MKRGALLAVVAAACSSKNPDSKATPAPAVTASDAAAIDAAMAAGSPALPPAAPVPRPPARLPAPPTTESVTAEAVALGELLFFDPRLSRGARLSCAGCHEPERGWASGAVRSTTVAGKPNLRHTPSLLDLAWQREFGWDGRFTSLSDALRSHWKGQLDVDPEDVVTTLARIPLYAAHFQRVTPGVEPEAEAALSALGAFVRTRYGPEGMWEAYERGNIDVLPAQAMLGYQLFTGKAQCSVCHVPPLYTDHGYHRLGLVASADEGRGRVNPAAAGEFKTPTLRGAALHPPYFHDGSAATLEAAVDWHLAGGAGQGASRSIIDPALTPVVLTDAERTALLTFVFALSPSPPGVEEYPRPALPQP